MIVILDIDDCINEFADIAVLEAEKYWQTKPDFTKGDGYRFQDIFSKSSVEVNQFLSDRYKEVFVDVGVKPDAVRALQSIAKKGVEFHVCTARIGETPCGTSDLAEVTRIWLQSHSIPYKKLVFTRDKRGYAKSVGAVLAIDDYTGNVHAYIDAGIPVIKFVNKFTGPVEHELCKNVTTWTEVETIFGYLLG